jgi:hypothetical protein
LLVAKLQIAKYVMRLSEYCCLHVDYEKYDE